jgi:hypothetical protein
MVIGKGGAYGIPLEVDPSMPVLSSDPLVAAHILANGSAPCTADGGDLLRTLGGGAGRGVPTLAYPVDLLRVVLDGDVVVAGVAHVIARHFMWRGEFAAAMNAAWLGDRYLGPRAHPNDGLVDVTFGRLAWQQRLLARRRVRTGAHLPHPDLTVVRRARWEHEFSRPIPIRVDDVVVGRARCLSIQVEPDAGVIVV